MRILRYVEIADDLERRIKEGEFTDRLPPYRKLITEYSVSSRTIDQVTARLKGRGVIYTVPSQGIFVKKDGS